jgi:hypothetical protein
MFQKYFRTPEFWEVDSSVDQNAMTQTTMPASTWLKGGVFAYPVLTYLNTAEFVEATKGFPGLIYVLLLPIQVISLGIALNHVIKRKATTMEVVLLAALQVCLSLVWLFVTIIWPFQLSWTILTLTHAWGYVKRFCVPIIPITLALSGLCTAFSMLIC